MSRPISSDRPFAALAGDAVAAACARAAGVSQRLEAGSPVDGDGGPVLRKCAELRGIFERVIGRMEALRFELEEMMADVSAPAPGPETARLLREQARQLEETKKNFVRSWGIFEASLVDRRKR